MQKNELQIFFKCLSQNAKETGTELNFKKTVSTTDEAQP